MNESGKRRTLDPRERAALRELSRRMQDDDPDLCRAFALAFSCETSWRLPWRWPAAAFGWLGIAFFIAGVLLSVASSICFGVCTLVVAGYRRRQVSRALAARAGTP